MNLDFKELVGNNYKVCFHDMNGSERWINGEIENFSGTILTIWCGKENGLYTIPYSSIRWMIPNILTRQKKELLEKRELEDASKKVIDVIKDVTSFTGKKPVICSKKELLEKVISNLENDEDNDYWEF